MKYEIYTGIQLVCSCVAVEAWLSMIHNNYCETKDLLIHKQHLIISQNVLIGVNQMTAANSEIVFFKRLKCLFSL